MKLKNDENDYYFGEREEQAVIDYIRSDSIEEKNRIYNEILLVPFKKMIQSILRRYPIHIGNYDMNEIESNALSHLIEQMVKFNPDTITKSGNKTKAYSYCQTIIRNYYKDHSKKSYYEKKVNLCYDDFVHEIYQNNEYVYELDIDNQQYLDKLIADIITEIETMINNTNNNLKKNEIIVGEAIVNILKNWNILFSEESPIGNYQKKITNKFEKNKILLYLKEQTGLNTKEIRNGIKPFKNVYYLLKLKHLDN